MKYTRQFNHRKHIAPVLGVLASLLFVVGQSAEARTYTTSVTINKYLGKRGSDLHGNPLYGVNVQQGGEHYYVELLNPMPCLTNHRYEQKYVTITRSGNHWMTAQFEGHTARIHSVTKLHDTHQSPYYHDHAASTGHDHHRTRTKQPVKVKNPFFGLFDW
ncbi:MAG: hypothetical protein P1V20_07360 [Verrucomicrobiales bacterium]|nr:hypothetical protein [Verrucomicrobiales bacterium]